MKKSCLFIVLFASCSVGRTQNVGIGTLTPAARLHVVDSAVMFTGPATVPQFTSYGPPASGAGSRTFWYPQKAAFRTGNVDGTAWDKDSIGLMSFGSGYNSKAAGYVATSLGYATTASGYAATSLGNATIASESSSTSMGYRSVASGTISTSIGYFSVASGSVSTSMGYATNASGASSTSMGQLSVASGAVSTSMGYGTIARSDYSLVIGRNNDTTNSNTLFEIGNGTSDLTRKNVVTVLLNGNVGFGNNTPNANLQLANTVANRKLVLYEVANNDHQFSGLGINTDAVRLQVAGTNADFAFYAGTSSTSSAEVMRIKGNGLVGIGTSNPTQALQVAGNIYATGTITPSDARFKKNIIPIQQPLKKLQQLNGVTYNYRSEEFPDMKFPAITQVGLIAQDVEKVFPQLVYTDDKGYKAVDYVKLIPLLIETAKAHEKEQAIFQQTIHKQQQEIDALKIIVKKLLDKK